ncbi:MAG TPA: hypothetical protein VK486_13895, partial [Thermoleophilaceae bacterium]|nr:hypothetical protein [Thermoleophilaceae bacterium]
SAKALRPVPSLRAKAFKALSETGATEVVASPADVAALQADVRASGVPAELRDPLGRLRVRGRDLSTVRAALLQDSSGGPVLVAPLGDGVRTRNLEAIAAELARYSKSARRTPIARAHAGRRSYRPRAAA